MITVIGFVGRFNLRFKGIDILLESCKELSSKFKHIHIILVGEGEI